MKTQDPNVQRLDHYRSHGISAHAAQRLVERMGCKHPIRHINKVKREGRLLWQKDDGTYALGRLLSGKVPFMYVFSPNGVLKTVMRREN